MNQNEFVSTKKKSVFRSSKRLIAMILIAATSSLSYGISTAFSEDSQVTSVTIVDGENHFEVETTGNTVEDALDVAEIDLAEEDVLSKNAESEISDGEVITVNRSKVFYLNTGGNRYEIKTTESTVGSALYADGFVVGKYDEVTPDVETPVTDKLEVWVTRVYVDLITLNEELPFETETVENPDKPFGTRTVLQKGVNGKVLRTFKKVTKENAGVTATLIGETIEQEAVPEIVEIGTKKDPNMPSGVMPPDGTMQLTPGKTADGIPYSALPTMAQSNSVSVVDGNTVKTPYGTFTFTKKIPCEATAYEGSAASNGKWAGQTATGRKPEYGVIAVDPKVIPLNTKVYVESTDGGKSWIYGFAVAGDTGGAIKGYRVDLCYSTLKQCYDFGRRNCTVYLLED